MIRLNMLRTDFAVRRSYRDQQILTLKINCIILTWWISVMSALWLALFQKWDV